MNYARVKFDMGYLIFKIGLRVMTIKFEIIYTADLLKIPGIPDGITCPSISAISARVAAITTAALDVEGPET